MSGKNTTTLCHFTDTLLYFTPFTGSVTLCRNPMMTGKLSYDGRNPLGPNNSVLLQPPPYSPRLLQLLSTSSSYMSHLCDLVPY